jgi:hypothetical protein
METRGIVYIATGQKYVEEAAVSARSAKEHMPDIPITLYSDVDTAASGPAAYFDNVVRISRVYHSCRDKIEPLIDSPYGRTLFLDTDTYLCAPVYDVFDMLDRFDIALAQAPDRYQYDLPDLPACFTELNSGVIAFRKVAVVGELLREWEATFNRMLARDSGSHRDQHSLRDALYRSSVRFLVLPPEYNFRTICPNFAGKHCAVKIIHGRHIDPEKVASRLNNSNNARVFLNTPYRLFTKEIGFYESIYKATMNSCFEHLPGGLQTWLSNVKSRLSS